MTSFAITGTGLILDMLGFGIIAVGGVRAIRQRRKAEQDFGSAYDKIDPLKLEEAESRFFGHEQLKKRMASAEKTARKAFETATLVGIRIESKHAIAGSVLIILGFILQFIGAWLNVSQP